MTVPSSFVVICPVGVGGISLSSSGLNGSKDFRVNPSRVVGVIIEELFVTSLRYEMGIVCFEGFNGAGLHVTYHHRLCPGQRSVRVLALSSRYYPQKERTPP